MGAKQRIDQLELEVKLLSKQIERLAPFEQIVRTLKEIVPEESYALYTKFGNRVSLEVDKAIKHALTLSALYGDEGDVCDCGHLYCDHCHDDPVDGTVAGCQIHGCKCARTWEGST